MTLFVACSWFSGFIFRMLVFNGGCVALILHRYVVGDEIVLTKSFVLLFLFFIVIELAIYVNMKAHANLFM